MDLLDRLINDKDQKVTWSDALLLYDLALFKASGVPMTEILIFQAQDKDLKNSIEMGIEKVIIPHIKKIGELLGNDGVSVPDIPQRRDLSTFKNVISTNALIQDNEIANSIRQVFRFGLNLDMRAITYPSKDTYRALGIQIFNDDTRAYDLFTKLCNQKGWLVKSPTL